MLDNVGQNFILNGEIKRSDLCNLDSVVKGSRVYEVIRVIGGVPLFFEDHLDRMSKSLKALGLKMAIKPVDLARQINLLKTSSSLDNFNVKVISYYYDNTQSCILYISRSYYPVDAEFEAGVPCGLLSRERENPNIKLLNDDYKAAVAKAISEKNVFEVLLVNSRGEITEGSKSNAFFLVNGKIRTAPGNMVLKGITRKYIIEACKNAGMEVIEQPVTADLLYGVEAAFISGTSIKVLPLSGIEQLKFSSGSNPIIKAIRKSYDKILDSYINGR